VNVYLDAEILARGFSGAQSAFGEADYAQFCHVRWHLVRRLLRAGYDAIILDPDLIYLSDPWAFIEHRAPGNCTFMSANELQEPMNYDLIAARGGLQAHRPGVKHLFATEPVFWNAGQLILSSDPASGTLAWVDEFIEYLAADPAHDDQHHLNEYLARYFDLTPSAPDRSVGTEIAEAVLKAQCFTYRRRSPAAVPGGEAIKKNDRPQTISAFVLHNRVFVAYPDYTIARIYRQDMLLPAVIHYNFVNTLTEKIGNVRGRSTQAL
jgi:hypothetical protein